MEGFRNFLQIMTRSICGNRGDWSRQLDTDSLAALHRRISAYQACTKTVVEQTCMLSFLSRYKAQRRTPGLEQHPFRCIYSNILSTMPANPPTLTTDELDLYLHRIRYADNTAAAHNDSSRVEHLQKSVERNPLEALTELQRRHLGSIPWGNSALHYSNHHSISINPTCVFEKLVVRRLDGYCMENTISFTWFCVPWDIRSIRQAAALVGQSSRAIRPRRAMYACR